LKVFVSFQFSSTVVSKNQFSTNLFIEEYSLLTPGIDIHLNNSGKVISFISVQEKSSFVNPFQFFPNTFENKSSGFSSWNIFLSNASVNATLYFL